MATHEKRKSADEVISGVYNWSQHKKQFSERQIRLALDVLSRKGWITHH